MPYREDPPAAASSGLMLALEPVPESVPAARRAVREYCQGKMSAAVADDAELLTSELVTNACRYSLGPVLLWMAEDGAGVVVSVGDDNPGQCRPRPRPSRAAHSGRGLFLVDHLATDWGRSDIDSGKIIWFSLPCDRQRA